MFALVLYNVPTRPCSRQCVRDCGLNETADSPLRTLPFRLYHPRSERPGTRRGAHYSNTFLELVGSHHTRERQWDAEGERATTPTYATAMQELHDGAPIYKEIEATHASLSLQSHEAVSPSASPKFMRELILKRKPRFVVEVGVFMGFTSIAMAKALDEAHGSSDAGPFVLSIDSWLGDAYMWVIRKRSKCKTCQGSYADILQPRHGKPAFYFNFLRNVASAGAARRVVPLPLATNEAARVVDYLGWRPELVYVDASHDAIDVLQDLEHFYYLLACGGALVGDDYHWTQVRLAVDWFAHHRRLQLRVFEIFGGGTNAERVVPVRLVGGARTFQGESNRGGASGSTINSKWLIEKQCRSS